MITPTVGRVVWYHAGPKDHILQTDQPLAAIITYIRSDSMVNLVVFDIDGVPNPRVNIDLVHGDAVPSHRAYCEWMPYQKGQASKTEALEKQLKEAV